MGKNTKSSKHSKPAKRGAKSTKSTKSTRATSSSAGAEKATKIRKARRDINNCTLGGFVVSVPKRLGKMVTFTYGVRSVHRSSDQLREQATYYTVKVFGAQAEFCMAHVKPGNELIVIGSVEAREYQLKINGEEQFYDPETKENPVMMRPMDLLARDVQFRH